MKAILVIIIMVFEGDAQPVIHDVEFDTMKSCRAAKTVLSRSFEQDAADIKKYSPSRYSATFKCVEK